MGGQKSEIGKEKRALGITMTGSFDHHHHCLPQTARTRDQIGLAPNSQQSSFKATHRSHQLNGVSSSARKHQLSARQMYSNHQFKDTSERRICRAPILPRRLRMLLTTALAASCLLLLLVCLPQPARTFFIDERQSPSMSDWNYVEQSKWREVHRECAGRAQSPIDIQHKNVIVSQHLRLHFYNYNQQTKFKLSNAHHTIKMNPIGAAYDDEGDTQHRHGGRMPAGPFNASSIHDMITADEYVEFLSSSTNQRHQQQQPGQGHDDATHSPPGHSQSQVDKERLVSLPVASLDSRLQHRVNLNNRPQTGPSGKQDTSYSDNGRHYNNNNSNNNGANEGVDSDHPNYVEHESGGDSEQAEAAVHAGAGDQAPYEGAPTIKLDWLDDGNNEYKLRDIHFHWGERRDNGSEHAIDGRRAAMEMHLVHIKQGLDKSKIGFTSDSVAVIAVLIESHRKSNADFNPIVNELARINATEEAREIDYKSIYDLLPSNLDSFYTYSGSLTTPPCYQVVNWIVMAERLNMNAKQIEMFRNLYAPAPSDHGGDGDSDDDHEDEKANRGRGAHQGASHDRPQHGSPPPDAHNQYKWRLRHGNNKPPVDPYTTKNQSFQSLNEAPRGADESDSEGGAASSQSSASAKWPEMIVPNVRSIQELNNRTILASFNKYGSRLKAVISGSYSVHETGHEQLNLLLVTSVFASLLGTCATPLLLRGGHHESPIVVR